MLDGGVSHQGGHRSGELCVNLTYVATSCSPRIDSDNDAALESEC
jgi:hypothetical protein